MKRVGLRHAGRVGEALVVELLEGGQVMLRRRLVGLTEEPLGFPDVGDGGDCLLERVEVRSPPRMVTKTRASKVRPRALASRCAW